MKKLMMTVGAALAAGVAAATTTFSYQGMLRDENGNAVSAMTKKIEFRLYGSEETEVAVWGSLYTVALGTNGIFNVELGDASGTVISGVPSGDLGPIIAAAANASTPLYIGLTVADSSGEIRPRQKVVAAPLAAYAMDVSMASTNFTVNGTATFNGGVNMVAGTKMTAGDVTASSLTVGGKTFLQGGANVSGGSVQIQDDVSVGGDTTVIGKLGVTNSVAVGGSMTVCGSLAVTGTITSAGVEVGVPVGTIVMWSGSASSVPKGWAICNGENGTPDLRGRFIVGVGKCYDEKGNQVGTAAYDLNERGGEETHALTQGELPSHTHSLGPWNYTRTDNNDDNALAVPSAKKIDHEVKQYDGQWNGSTGSCGSNQAHENRPPYYALYYIIKVQ